MVILLISKNTLSASISVNGVNVGYDNSTSGFKTSTNADVTEIQTAIDELYNKVKDRTCPNTVFTLGNYFYMVPDVATYSFPTSLSGYTSAQTINIAGTSDSNGLRLWRVIDVHADGSVDAVSEYVSYNAVYFKGTIGYQYYVAGLQAIAAKFGKIGYTIGTRIMGYSGQTPVIGTTTAFAGTTNTPPSTSSTPSVDGIGGKEYNGGILGDSFTKDLYLVYNVYKSDPTTYGQSGLKAYVVGSTTYGEYYTASRQYRYNSNVNFAFGVLYVTNNDVMTLDNLRSYNNGWSDGTISKRIRPIITLKSDVTISGGSGTKASPYTLS